MTWADDLEALKQRLGESPRARQTAGLGIPRARDLSDDMFRDVGQMADVMVARLAEHGLIEAWNSQPTHPMRACAIRVAWARAGSTDPEDATNADLIDWVRAHSDRNHDAPSR